MFSANKITLYLNIIFSDRTFFAPPHQIALLPGRVYQNCSARTSKPGQYTGGNEY
ncbi:hypothetical protein [[Scytonema hofmanni] UTEX B 1581]|uniref:hypothetical protein n=1 Tax=[Scytonema hofmanni] UTEX B 1581 TaxID=379535 RepID=UPI0021B0C5AD|nr:hypothetical protein [[Scytonema hofmanni] UTEX B 1581]